MKLRGLYFGLGFILTLLVRTDGKTWRVNVTRDVPAPLGSDVIIHCSFASPSHLDTGKVSIYWKRTVKTYVFHANETNVLEMYRGKTKLVGRKERGDCSLMIQNFREDNLQIYLRVIVDGSPYSFVNDSVRIRLSESNDQRTVVIICVAVFVPFALAAISLAGGTYLRRKRKRNMVLKGEDSRRGSFRKTLSNQVTSKETSPKQVGKTNAQEINDPIYINFDAETFPEWTNERTTHNNESIYENVNNQMLAGCCS